MAKRNWLKAGLASLLLSMAVAPLSAAAPSDNIRYRIQKNENLYTLAQAYFLNLSDYKQVQRLNNIANPRRIPIGTVIEIPRSLLKYRSGTARLLSVKGNVTNRETGAKLRDGQTLGEGATLVTVYSSFATIVLDDGSRISLPSNSVVQISRLRTYLLGGSVDYDFNVIKGSAQSRVTKKSAEDDRYRVRTKRAVTAVRGTEFQSRYDEMADADFAEVDEGVVEVTAGGKVAPIQSGSGLSVSADGEVRQGQLLPSPTLLDAGQIKSDALVQFTLKGAGPGLRYHVMMATDAGFINPTSEMITVGGTFGYTGIADGNYFLRVREVAPSGLQGLPATYGFKRRFNSIRASVKALDNGYAFRWAGEGKGVRRFHFQLLRTGNEALPIIDEAGMATQQIVISDLPPGEYWWRVGSVQYLDGEVATNWTTPEKLTISAQ